MTDRTPTGEQQDPIVESDRTDGTRQDATVTVFEAARILGVSTDAVRSRLRRGTLKGEKIESEWHIRLSDLHGTRQDGQPSPPGPRQDATDSQQDATVDRQAGQQEPDRTPTVVDLAPLTDLIERQAQELQRLTEAATMWQMRARQFEERLQALTVGETPPETVPEPPGSPQANEIKPRGLWVRLREWWGGP